ncbi:phage minor capsid protein [Streptacidiphilus cavernicola]|uniref:Phage minor capsid protein n=1 Tax=Streptacidiphilus cavernicola TaxID=3342716 RepID=A0ABV6W238_9ACTN
MSSYPYPPLIPGDPREVADRVAEALAAAWQELEDSRLSVLARILAGGGHWRLAHVLATIEEYKQAITEFSARVDEEAQAFVSRQLPYLYEQGAERVQLPDGGPFTWTKAHSDALQSLAADSYGDFLRRSQEAQRMAEVWYRIARQAARETVPRTATGGTTALQAAKKLADRLGGRGLNYVIYRNGARVPVRAWAESATLAKSAVAYNSGTLNRAVEAGVRFMQVFDGSGCGWTSHDDPDKANGTVRTVEEAAEQPIAHPRCLRAFGPRPDLGDL